MWTLLLALSPALADAPEVPLCSVLGPAFTVDGETKSMGAMFGIRHGERTLLATAHHLFGPAGGLKAQLTGEQLPASVTAVTVRDVFSSAVCGKGDAALTVADAKPMDAGDNSGDVALFPLNRLASTGAKSVAARPLAEAAPAKGDTVYVVGKVPGQDKKAWKAEVVELADNAMYYQLEDKSFGATSGNAVVNAEGAVVGIHLGGGAMDDGSLIGTSVPWGALKARVEAAK